MARATSTTVFCLLVLLAGTADAKLGVVTTHGDLAAITRAVGGDRVEVASIVEPTQDPHFVDARPHLMLVLNRADLVILVGLQLEVGWLPNLLTGARNPEILPGTDGYLDSSTLVSRLQVPKGSIDRSMGDLHPGGNPHFTKAPESGLRIAHGVARRLSRLDPEGAGTYRRNLARFERERKAAMVRWRATMAPLKGTKVVAYHESWVYFADWLGLVTVRFVDPKPGIPPDPAHVARLLGRMRADGVKVILQEEYYPDATARLLADKSGAKLLLTPGAAHVEKGQGYVDYVDWHVRTLASTLGSGG